MTSAPLPAPLPCPFCNGAAHSGYAKFNDDAGWCGCESVDCPGWGACAQHQTEADAVAAWNRRAPEAQAWRAIETAPRDGTRILIADGRSTDAAYWSQCAKGYGGSKRYPWVILDETNGVNGMTETHPTHWQPLPAPPGATPAAPPAREAALVEALRHLVEVMGPPMSLREADAIASARAALAEAEGRAKP